MLFSKPLSPTDRARLDEQMSRLSSLRETFVGYPCNQAFDYSELYPFLGFVVNNIGDPFGGQSHVQLNTHELEREVVQEFARFTRAPADRTWGYVTNGGTEGNMYGAYLAREIYPDGMVYFSEDTHYSVAKILRVLHQRNIMIKSLRTGEMDTQDLKETLRIHRDVPPIIFANIGTTMKGAIDDLARIRAILEELAITRYYIHCDAALSGLILPFVDEPPPFGFEAGAHSISISGHKMIGSPIPCGVVLALKSNVERVARSVEYVGVLDTTLTGSRNGITPLFLWYALKRSGVEGFRSCIRSCIERADHVIRSFSRHGIRAWRHPNSITVVFPRPSEAVIRKWQVAPYRDIAHIITMPHVTRDLADAFVADVVRDRNESAAKAPDSALHPISP